MAWLETHPGVEMTNRLSPTIGGLSGHAFDLTATGDGLLCDGETKLLVQDWSSDPNFWWGIGADERQHMIVLDRGSGGTIVMVVAALDRPEFALFADLVAPILGTIDFDQQCQTDDPECTGALSPGTHSTGQHMTPCSYTVPVGWSKPLDVPGSMNLESRAFSGALIGVIPEWAIASQSACTADPEPGRGRELQDLVDFLAEHPGLIASVPAPVTVGGLEGQVIDIQVDPAFEGPCNGEVSLFTHRGTINDVGWWTIRDSSRGRYYFLDAGDGVVINVIVETVVSEDLDAFLGAATPVVDTFDFSP